MPFSHGPKIPSIPSRADTNGYDITDRNDLTKNPADDNDLTLGPAFYDVPRGELNFNSKRYGGCAWAKSKDKRLKTASFQGPGPGYYDVNFNFCGHRREDEQIRATMRKCCGAPRYTCELICRAKRENIPGPGAYKTVDLRELGEIKCLSLHPRPFIDSRERFVEIVNDVPGPQEYSACDCVLLKRSFGTKNVPFLCSSDRLKGATAKQSLGPGWYPTPKGMVEKLLVKRYGAVSVPFGSNVERKWTFQEVPLDTPASVDYDINEPRCCPTECPHETSVFRSRVCRFRRKKPDNQPECATYNITKAVHFCRNQVSHAKRRRSFNHTEEKFLPLNDFACPIYEDTPGVGDYEISGTLVLDKAMKFDNKPRFKPIKCYPGPGYYSLHPKFGESMNRTKTTHNARLMKEVKRNYCDARIPKPTVKPSQPTGKKLLRWFVRPPEQPPC